ncbi:hypothetical protein [Estrella lausannensis]|uniref:Uncharacterized protein n=1 Tax=Estrella lausannensis TaxID=483423 RepID=A0A0H5E3B4_9BACT|nr:hypothetical protein [Estrella lausannensis]CRX37710.1 hypothetical protein ELAC_0349 [Estrella lausannensis]
MTTQKIDVAHTFKTSPAVKKKEPQKEKAPASGRWQEVEERRSAPKSPLVKEEKPAAKKKERLMASEKRERAFQEMKEQSPFDLFTSMQSKTIQSMKAEVAVDEPEYSEETDSVELESAEGLFASDETKEEEETKAATPLVNLIPVGQEALYQPTQSLNNHVSSTASPVANASFQNMKLLQFAEKLVKKITAMKQGGRTEITLTLKNMSLFNGGILKVVEHDSARGQYNLTFTNLNPKAHALVLGTDATRILRESMEAKGLTFHIITASTEIEPLSTYSSSFKEEKERRDEKSEDADQETA